MKSLQDYRDIFREIASKLNLQGDSVELLVQLLSQASYIGEVENAVYMKEASLESATLMNSKIQHCMDNMYSVFRGTCPRVVVKFIASKYYDLKMYDVLSTSNNFKIYYLGYLFEDMTGFGYGPTTIYPGQGVVLVGLIAKDYVDITKSPKASEFYMDCEEENLSEDMYVKVIDKNMKESFLQVTRNFDDHLLNGKVFDLTTTSFGSRLYFPESLLETVRGNNNDISSISATYFKRTELSDYNASELKKISVPGSEMSSFNDGDMWEDWVGSMGFDSEVAPGIILLEATGRDSLETIHYRASRDRFTSSIIRSNSDVGTVLEEAYPEKVVLGGTTYDVVSGDGDDKNVLYIYYIPDDENNLLTTAEIEKFISTKKAYYITDNIVIKKGSCKKVVLNIDVDLYQNTSIDSEVESVLRGYEKKFGIDLSDSSVVGEIKTLIGKISNVAGLSRLDISVDGSIEDISKTYYTFEATIHSKLVE